MVSSLALFPTLDGTRELYEVDCVLCSLEVKDILAIGRLVSHVLPDDALTLNANHCTPELLNALDGPWLM